LGGELLLVGTGLQGLFQAALIDLPWGLVEGHLVQKVLLLLLDRYLVLVIL
jgi:hypothetical protein